MSDKVYPAKRYSIDVRAIMALEKLGVIPGVLESHPVAFHKRIFMFTFTGSRELAKYHVQTFLEDEYSARQVEFFARPNKPHQCYAVFSIHDQGVINAQEVEANNRRCDRERQACGHSSRE